jgi:elongator complex protein 3
MVLQRANEKGIRCACIRCREVVLGDREVLDSEEDLEYDEMRYLASGGTEVFGSYEYRKAGLIAGFIRLRIPSEMAHRPEVKVAGIVRELRVYGRMVQVGSRDSEAWQHGGLGREMMRRAEIISSEEFDAKQLVVTSAVGTRNYYRKQGFERSGPYMAKKLG